MSNGVLDALIGGVIGYASQGQAVPAYQSILAQNRRNELLAQIQAAGGITTPEGQRLAQQDPELAQQLMAQHQQLQASQMQQARMDEYQEERAGQARFRQAKETLARSRGSLSEQTQMALIEMMIEDPSQGRIVLDSLGLAEDRLDSQKAVETVSSLIDLRNDSKKKNPEKYLSEAIKAANEKGLTELSRELKNLHDHPKEVWKNMVDGALAAFMDKREKIGLLKNKGSIAKGVKQKYFEYMTEGFTEEEKKSAKRRAMGLEAKTGTLSKEERLAGDVGMTEAVAGSQAAITGAKEEAKLAKQLAFKPQIEESVSLARQQAKSRGETFGELQKARASMPGLTEAVNQLKALAGQATYTMSGRAFDTVVKETGFGSTKGADARAKFVAIVNNQVLPLLKQTFGAAFTEGEGNALRATMGDPDASPDEKMAQLEAFIAQKIRDIEAKEMELGVNRGTEMSDEELLRRYGG